MRLSQLFGNTLRQPPADAVLTSHRLLLRAGMLRSLTADVYAYLPLGWRVIQKIEDIFRQEMDSLDGQEICLPALQPGELWRASGRLERTGASLLHFHDHSGRHSVLAPSDEEALNELLRREIHSHRQLPLLLYQIQTRFHDEPHSGGLLRPREFLTADAYSLHANLTDPSSKASGQGLESFYRRMLNTWATICQKCKVETLTVEADVGEGDAHAFVVLHDDGDETVLLCTACDYAANAARATFQKGQAPAEPPGEVQEIATPGCKTIAALADFVGVPERRTLKAVFYADRWGQVTVVVIRGDLEVNEVKLRNALGGAELHPATEDELLAVGIVAGYASPVGLSGVRVVADDSIQSGVNFVAGANREGYHLLNVNYPRDFAVDWLGDIALARGGHPCPRCRNELREKRAIEVGRLSKPGVCFSQVARATYLDEQGQTQPLAMGAYRLFLGRLMAAIVEQHHDKHGIVWPASVAPYQVHLVALGLDQEAVAAQAETLYKKLLARGYEVLFDDRNESAGVKFNDADLIGIPLRLTISARSLQRGGVEAKLRWEREARIVAVDEVEAEIAETSRRF
ncbi:MAG: proline--tRNA ligase [Anaerolineae bacterium]|jgi:prolyl-tRNA synthetase|nr:proline--tRNA ligase [Anaerolineae bacterium]MDH7474216.1 proline--tRNA ligase [Anaerolineae bacterium]